MENTVTKPVRPRGRPRRDAAMVVPDCADTTAAAEQVSAPRPAEVRPEVRAETRTPETRTAPRASDSRTAADARAKEILDHLNGMEEGTDEFFIPANVIPEGWTYEWKRRTTYGKEDPAYQVALARTGWQIVPTSRHPDMMPAQGNYDTIERKGMVLMERPEQITDLVRMKDDQRARDQVRAKEAQLSGAADGQFSRTEDPRTRPNIKKSYEHIAIPTDK